MLYAPRRSLSGAPLSVSPWQSPLLHIAGIIILCLCPAKRYTPDHEVITFDDNRGVGTVSITDYAQKSLGDVVFVELPQAGTTIEQGGESLVGIPPIKVVPVPFYEESNRGDKQNLLAQWRASKRPRISFVSATKKNLIVPF